MLCKIFNIIMRYFSFWIYIWYLLYRKKYIEYNPLFALIIAFIIGYILFIIPMIRNKLPFNYLFYFTIGNFIIKMIPIYLLLKSGKRVVSADIMFTIILFSIYLYYIKTLGKSFFNIYNNTLFIILREGKKGTSFFELQNYIL